MNKSFFRDALTYVELARDFYVVSSALFLLGFFIYPIIFFRNAAPDFLVFVLVMGFLSSLPSLLLAWLTHNKIIKLLKEGEKPSIKWAKSLEILGYFLGLFIAGLMLYIANKKLENLKLLQSKL